MTFQVRIQNIGKLADATVRVSPLTVLAGANNTGKTFFSKILYSAFDSVNDRDENHAVAAFTSRVAPVMKNLNDLDLPQKIPNGDMGFSLQYAVEEMGNAIGAYNETGNVPDMSPESLAAFGEATRGLKRAYKQFVGAYSGSVDLQWLEAAIDPLVKLGDMSPDELTMAGVESRFSENLLLNLQCGPTLEPLRGRPLVFMYAKIEGAGKFSFALEGDNAKFIPDAPPSSVLAMLRKHAKVRFLGPPVLWQMRTALNNARVIRLKRSSNGRKLMDGVPKYVDDLEELLTQGDLSGNAAFPEILQNLTETIGGKIVRDDDSGQLFFHEGKNSVPLPSTASGVVPLGILALLIEKKLVDKGAFLFIDEPEANLHPAWQVEMVRALFELAQGGVNVVLATHSVDIVKYLDVHLQEHPELKELVELNHFTREGVVVGDKDFGERMDDIMLSLTDPFHKLCLDEIRASWSPS